MTENDRIAFAEFKAAQPLARSLREVGDLTDMRQVAIALRLGGFSEERICTYYLDAIEIEKGRRTIEKLTGADHDALSI